MMPNKVKTVVQDYTSECEDVFGEETPEWAKAKHTITAEVEEGSGRLYAFVGNEETGEGIALVLAVNHGVPCVHVSQSLCGDNEFHIYGGENGLVLQSECSPPYRPTMEEMTLADGELLPDCFVIFKKEATA